MAAELNAPAHAPTRPRSGLAPGWLVFGVVALPGFAFYVGVSTSNTLGVVLISLILLARRFLPSAAARHPYAVLLGSLQRQLLFILAAVVLHFVLVSLLLPTDPQRALGSLVPLTLQLLAAGALVNTYLAASARRFERSLRGCFLALAILALLSVAGLAPPSPTYFGRPVFPFSEPSMFAVAFIPLAMYACVAAKESERTAFLLLTLACATLAQSLTLVVGCTLIALASLRWRPLVLIGLLVAAIASQLDLTYYAIRLNFASEDQNMTTLVYLQGWQLIDESLSRSNGLGIGFQQLGVQGSDVPAAELLRAMRDGDDANILDGGFVFAKLASDFGVLGILVTAAYLVLAARSLMVLRRVASGRVRLLPALAFAHCCVLGYFVELFVRGSGYFTGGSLLLMAAILLLHRSRRLRKARPRRAPARIWSKSRTPPEPRDADDPAVQKA